ncbi:MAG TPA: extensin family protein [Hansschlegelia sp.]
MTIPFVRRLAQLLAAGLIVAAVPAAPIPVAAREAKSATPWPQLRLPWQSERKPARRTKRSAKPAKPARSGPQQGKRPVAAPARPADADALPHLDRPPTLAPFARSEATQAEWRAVAAQLPPPDAAPALSPDGPAPAPAFVVALIPHPIPADEPDPDVEQDGPPLPPQRPVAEAQAAAPTGGEVPLPPKKPGDIQTAALIPKAPLPTEPPEPGPPDVALPEVAREDDPDCKALDAEAVAIQKPLSSIHGPGVCSAGPLVELTGVRRKNGGVVEIKPAATLRCAMARTVAAYVRDDLAPAAEAGGASLAKLEIAGSYVCRGRNNVAGGKLSEHGRANAIDISGLALADGRSFGIYAKDMPDALASVVKGAACGRFSTVLGPGSDSHHEDHLHVDLQPRRGHGKLCQWAVDEPADPTDEAPKQAGEKSGAER